MGKEVTHSIGRGQTIIANGKRMYVKAGRCELSEKLKNKNDRPAKVIGRRKKLTKPPK